MPSSVCVELVFEEGPGVGDGVPEVLVAVVEAVPTGGTDLGRTGAGRNSTFCFLFRGPAGCTASELPVVFSVGGIEVEYCLSKYTERKSSRYCGPLR